MAATPRLTPVILCGGAGTRLWPLSRSARPKQMLPFAGEESMLQATARRVADPNLFEPPVYVAAANQREAVEREVGVSSRFVLEACPRNTAMAIALAALNAPEATLLVLPSDHLVRDVPAFLDAVRRGMPAAAAGSIVTFGMHPDRADTGFGYIERGEPIDDGVWSVRRFVEKPGLREAEDFVAGGKHDWNGGIFLMRSDVLLAGLEAHAPLILAAARRAVVAQRSGPTWVEPDPVAVAEAPALSIDHALIEHFDRTAVVPAAIGWSDLGSWEAAYDISATDNSGNAIFGDAVVIDSRNCLVRSEGPFVAALGVEDLIIVATGDAILVMPRSHSQRVREVVDHLGQTGREKLK